MKTTNKVIMAVALIVVMLIGVGYAAIRNITFNITGSATATPNDANFSVKFAETTEVSDANKVTAAVTNDTNATINVVGLTSAGETVTATYTVQNTSADLSADLTVETTNNNEEYFEISSKLGNTSIVAGEATTLTLTVKLIKTPIEKEEKATIGIQLTAEPVQPGEEGTSGGAGGSGSTTMTLASVTNANIGDYIDLGNNIVGENGTKDDWRILYVDEEKGKVYAILADYLPNSTEYAKNAGLDTMGTYGVYSKRDRATLLNELTTESNWQGLANGIIGATVKGTPTPELLVKSYNAKKGINLDYKAYPDLEPSDLYLPDTSHINDFIGCWLDLPREGDSYYVWCIKNGGYVRNNMSYTSTSMGIRPVVYLSSSINVIKEGTLWTVVK